MKTINLLILGLIMVVSFGCSEDGEPTTSKDQKISDLVSGTWVTESVTTESNLDVTPEFTNFSITFVKNPTANYEGDYYATNGSPAFSDSFGSWKFNGDFSKLVFNNGQAMQITLSPSSLTLNLYVSDPGGRTSSVSGNITFKLKKK